MKTKPFIFCFVILLISTNAIAQWTELNVTPNHTAKSYDFIDDNIGYASLKLTVTQIELAKTIDGGNSWSIIRASLKTQK